MKSSSPDETEQIGYRIGLRVIAAMSPGGDFAAGVISLEGPLGAGKTVLVRGLARALGIEEPITSPTFTLISHYRGRPGLDLYHVDLYRIDREEEIEDLGLEDLMGPGSVVVLEWGEKAAALLPGDAARVRVRIAPDGGRLVEMQGLSL